MDIQSGIYYCIPGQKSGILRILYGQPATEISFQMRYLQNILVRPSNLVYGLFGDIFTLNADYIAWKLLKMALAVEYMMEYQHQSHLRPAKMTQNGTFYCIYMPI